MSVDPVVLQLRADVAGYKSSVRGATSEVERLLGRQEKSVQSLERQFRNSTTGISSGLKGIAGTLATYFTGRELIGLIDNFTRLQNSLRVAGLEGDRLASVQSKLLDIGTKYGVSVNSLADLFGRVSLGQKDLGASQEGIITLTTAVSQALKITGTSANNAAGAILGLTQALGQSKIQATEFDQINEGGLRPLLQLVANTEKYGGSLVKLRAALESGALSGKQLYDIIISYSSKLESKASKSVLTLEGAFTALTNKLTVFVGQSAQTNGATNALSEGILLVADNLDVLANALAVIIAAIGVRYVASLVSATVSTIALGAASTGTAAQMGLMGAATFAMQARMAGAATSAEAMWFALGGIGKGGLIGAAILAIGAALYYTVAAANAATPAALAKADADARMAASAEAAASASNQLAKASEKERAAIIASMKASRARAAQSIQTAKALIAEARAALEISRAKPDTSAAFIGPDGSYIGSVQDSLNVGAEKSLRTAEQKFAIAEGRLAGLDKAIADASKPIVAAAIGGVGKEKKGKKAKTETGPTVADIAKRFDDERANFAQQALSGMQAVARSVDERAEYELRSVELARIRTLADINADKDYSSAQKAVLRTQVERNAQIARDGIEFEKQRQIEQDQRALADETFRASQDGLAIQYDLATSQKARQDIALKMLEAEQNHLQEILNSVILSKTANDAEKERARVAKLALYDNASKQREQVVSRNATPGEAYLKSLKTDADQLNEAYQTIAVDGLRSLNDGITEAIIGSKSLGDAFKNVANQIIADLIRIAVQKAITEPLANALFGGGSSIKGSGSGLLGGLFGRAGGGYVAPGQVYRVNEGAGTGRAEAFMSRDGGTIIPLGQTHNMLSKGGQSSGPAIVQVHVMEGQMFEPRVQAISGDVSVQVVRASAPAIIDASAKETFARSGRPRL